jgi:hypothetical protein
MQYDKTDIDDILDSVFDDYLTRRIEELLSTQRGASRISTDEIQGTLGKAQAAKELHSILKSKF